MREACSEKFLKIKGLQAKKLHFFPPPGLFSRRASSPSFCRTHEPQSSDVRTSQAFPQLPRARPQPAAAPYRSVYRSARDRGRCAPRHYHNRSREEGLSHAGQGSPHPLPAVEGGAEARGDEAVDNDVGTDRDSVTESESEPEQGIILIFPLNWGCFPPCISVYICAILPLNIDISSQKLEKTDVLNMARIVAYLFISMKILHILRHDQEVPLSGVCR